MAAEWLKRFAETVEKNKEELTKLDQAVGDGDHGINMNRGLQEVLRKMEEVPADSPGGVVKAAAMICISKVGGASGPLYGSALMKIASALGDEEDVEGKQLTKALRDGVDAIKKRGRAEEGEKTMVDVWEPAVQALEQGSSWQELTEIVKKARDNTIDMKATKGRAAYLGDRSIGHLDPGAVSSSYFFLELACVMEESS
ncbi:dihydroxyacetone kinase subunit DhaL [Alkalicoccus urumqiensis]|uniref:phosphoenolpyruvate--glycerone phosphotransferase n=1 Tax=Alkalicoccus urumqiensis TaxID=1548213 RepID=A0A2P6MD70_ALKUR|nr:dihydroxyacetone kinase subunit DhaL [Alkalicoccus urumqiensis]PRO64231.1 dihydroxyacetone kinase subunit L [Alkalicoccus urumqiensis]